MVKILATQGHISLMLSTTNLRGDDNTDRANKLRSDDYEILLNLLIQSINWKSGFANLRNQCFQIGFGV